MTRERPPILRTCTLKRKTNVKFYISRRIIDNFFLKFPRVFSFHPLWSAHAQIVSDIRINQPFKKIRYVDGFSLSLLS